MLANPTNARLTISIPLLTIAFQINPYLSTLQHLFLCLFANIGSWVGGWLVGRGVGVKRKGSESTSSRVLFSHVLVTVSSHDLIITNNNITIHWLSIYDIIILPLWRYKSIKHIFPHVLVNISCSGVIITINDITIYCLSM